MKKLLLFVALGAMFNVVPGQLMSSAEASLYSCFDSDRSGILQDLCAGACPGEVFYFRAAASASSYSWSVFQGATIVGGQGTRTVSVLAPSSGGFSISLSTPGGSYFDLAEYDAGCP